MKLTRRRIVVAVAGVVLIGAGCSSGRSDQRLAATARVAVVSPTSTTTTVDGGVVELPAKVAKPTVPQDPPPPPQPVYSGGVLSGGSIYAVESTFQAESRVVRLSVPDGRVLARSAPMSEGAELAVGGGAVWFSEGEMGGARHALHELDPATLAERRQADLPPNPGQLAFAGGALWVISFPSSPPPSYRPDVSRAGIYRLDPATLRVTAWFPVRGEVASLALDATGRFLYTSENSDELGDAMRVTRRDAVTGRLLASHPVDGAGPGALVVAGNDAWLDYPTGMANSMLHLRGPRLAEVPVIVSNDDEVAPSPWFSGGAGRFDEVAVNGTLWITNEGLPGLEAVCLDPTSGRPRSATISLPGGNRSDLVVGPDQLYVLDYPSLHTAPIPPACRPIS